MFCDRCGAQVEGSANFCPSCGKSFSSARPSGAPVMAGGGRVSRHIRRLGIFWLIYAGWRLMGALAMRMFPWGDFWNFDVPWFVPGLMRSLGFLFLLSAAAGLLAGWGLLERRPWARILAIVLAVLVLFKFPVGTALGIYTLWVLAPAESDAEYRMIQRPV